MKDNAEKMKCVMLKVSALKKKREKRKEIFYKAASGVFLCLLICCISVFQLPYQSAGVAQYCGAIVLVGGIGGYVLTAVLTFVFASIITVVCIKTKNRGKTK